VAAAPAGTRDWLAASGAVFVGLFGAGILIADWSAAYPNLSQPVAELHVYFTENVGAVRALGLFHAFAALALLVFGAHMAARLRGTPGAGSLPELALAGGTGAGILLLVDAMVFWTLAAPSVAGDPALLRGLHTLSYLAGGVFLLLPLGAFIGVVSAVALRTGLLPRWLGWWGVAAAVESFLYGTTLVAWEGPWSPGGVLVVGAAIPVVWVLLTSISLFRGRSAGYPLP
jgi:hypothetical protein